MMLELLAHVTVQESPLGALTFVAGMAAGTGLAWGLQAWRRRSR